MSTGVTQKKLLDYLLTFVSENKKALFDQVLNYRTRHLTVVLEDIYQPQNASATIRSCDIYGIQDLHVIENKNLYELDAQVAMGSGKWVDIINYNSGSQNTVNCLKKLKEDGYKVVATSPHATQYTIHDLPLDQKTALCFGTELTGLSQEAMDLADELVSIPMYGFTESFNISVSVAICLSHLKTRLHNSSILWQLSENEREELLLSWSRKCIRGVELIESEFFKKRIDD